MKAHIARHAMPSVQPVIFMLCLVGLFVSITCLGSMRLYALYLEHRLASISSKIEVVVDKNAELEERYSALLSPSRVYNYAMSELNMVTAQEVETIRLRDLSGALSVVAYVPNDRREPVQPPSMLEMIFMFTGVANAQD